MINENNFSRHYWNSVLADLTKKNISFQNLSVSAEEVISRFDNLAIDNHTTNFGYNDFLGSLKFEIGIKYSIDLNFTILIRMEPVKQKYRGAYLEINLVHTNGETLLANTYLPCLPFNTVDELIKKLPYICINYHKELLNFRKKKKKHELHFSLIKSMLMIKFKSSSLKWKIIDFDNENDFKIIVTQGDKEIWSDFVTDKDCIEKINDIENKD